MRIGDLGPLCHSTVIISPEYPPDIGGVSFFSEILANVLAAEGTNVWVISSSVAPTTLEGPIKVIADPRIFQIKRLRKLDASTTLAPKYSRIFLQWVPHGFGYKSLNLFFVLWVAWRVLFRSNPLWLMVHEPFLEFGGNFRVNIASLVHRFMIWILLRLASRAFASNRKWIEKINGWKPDSLLVEILPVPSTILENNNPGKNLIPVCEEEDFESWKKKPIGHFGTFGHNTVRYLEKIIPGVLNKSKGSSFLLIGKGSQEFRNKLILKNPELASRVAATGSLGNSELIKRVSECSVMVQVCEGGVSFRNTSIMAALSLAKPVVANSGLFTEREWHDWDSVNLCNDNDFHCLIDNIQFLVDNPKSAIKKGLKNFEIYHENFSKEKILEVLKKGC